MATPAHSNPKTAPLVGSARPERAHPRVRVTGHVEIGGQQFKLYDVSAGGLCFEGNGRSFRPGESQRGSVAINADGVVVTLSAGFQVRNLDPGSRRVGCAFENLGAQEASVLRRVITAQLAGDSLTPAELGQTQGVRDAMPQPQMAFPPPRPAPTMRPAAAAAQGEGGGRLRALVTTALFLGAAVVAFGYTARQVNRVMFASTAAAAKVAGPTYAVMMPREGTFYSLVPEDGVVKKGAPIASFEAPVLDLVRNQTLGANMTPEQLQKLMKVTVKGTITSPCDCKVQTQHVTDGQYVAKEQLLFDLMPRDFEPYLVARFRNDQLGNLATGQRVSFQVAGENQQRTGKIKDVRAHGVGDTVDTDVMVTIAPDEPLPTDLLSRPAEVVAGGIGLPDVVTDLTATARERTD